MSLSLTVKLDSVPPVTVISSDVKPLGVSLKVKVSVAVSPALSVVLSLLISSVGAKVSMLMFGVVPAWPVFPTALVYAPAATVMLALPEAMSAVGVKVAV